MKRAIFLDRDGVLNRDVGYAYKITDYELLPGVKLGLKKLRDAGYFLFILTNQSGIGRGFYTETDYHKFMVHLFQDLRLSDIWIEADYFCPHHPTEARGRYRIDCQCRKPKPGLLLACERDYGPFDHRNSWLVGDSARDIAMGKNVVQQMRGVLLPKNYGTDIEQIICSRESKSVDFAARNFLEAVDIILNNGQ